MKLNELTQVSTVKEPRVSVTMEFRGSSQIGGTTLEVEEIDRSTLFNNPPTKFYIKFSSLLPSTLCREVTKP